jgi:hypothetical protein
MERNLLLGALTLGSLGWLVGLLLADRPAASSRRVPPLFAGVAVAILAAVAAITVPGRAIWSAGQSWGHGLILGGAAALLAGWVWRRAGPAVPGARPISDSAIAAGPFFAGVVPVAAVLLWLGAAVLDGLAGVASGWFLVSLLLAAGADLVRTRDAARSETPGSGTNALVSTGFVVTLCATVALGHYRDLAGSPAARWVTSAVVLAIGVPLLMLLGGLFGRTGGREESTAQGFGRWILRLGVPSLLLIGLAQLIASGILMQLRLTAAVGVGIAMVLLAWWLSVEPASGDERPTGVTAAHILPVFTGLAGVIAAFYALTGYGVGVMLIAAWLPVGLIVTAPRRTAAATAGELPAAVIGAGERLTQVMAFGVLLLLYRLFVQRFQDDLSGATLVDHFALFTMIAGVLLPALLGGILEGRPGGSPANRVGRVLAVVLLAAAVPAAMLILWGSRAGIGLVTGLALASVLYPRAVSCAWVALASALPMMQWTHQTLQLALLTRDERMRLLLALGAVIAILILLADLGGRVTATLHRRSSPPLEPGTQRGAGS